MITHWRIAAVILAGLSVAVCIAQPDRLDPLCRLIGLSDTVYAAGFSRARFAQVYEGMRRQDVEQRLGRGFATFTAIPCDEPGAPDQPRWFYSAGAGNHWRFWITFTPDHRVSRIQREFWWD